MSNWTGRLKSKMKELGLTQHELAKKMGVTRSAIAHYVQGTRHPPLRQVIKLATILKVDPAWLQFGKAQGPTNTASQNAKEISNRIPILDWNQALDFDYDHFRKKSNDQNYLDYFNLEHAGCYALLIKGDSMVSPLGQGTSFNQGSYIIVDPNKTPKHGNFVLTIVHKKEPVLRQYMEEGGTIYLKPLNPQYPLMQLERNTKILGIVIAKINLL